MTLFIDVISSMGRSIICDGVPLFACIAVLATLVNATTPKITSPRPLYEKDGFLAGEETPVWYADIHRDPDNNFTQSIYTLVTSDGVPVVKKSLNYWDLLKKRSGFPVRTKRSIDDRGNSTYTEFHDVLRNPRIKRFGSPSPVETQSADSSEVVYPSLLVVVDYHDVFPTPDKKTPWSLEELVLYTLAFWSTVDSSLRNIQNPRVSLRVSGIVVTKSRQASPYLGRNSDERTFAKAFSPMMDHWRSVSKRTDSDFPIDSYDIVAHMTDIFPRANNMRWTSHGIRRSPILGVSSQGPPCKLTDQIGGVIIYDDLAFNGIHRAIAQMSKVLGGSDQSPVVYGAPRRRWTKELVNPISNALNNTSCMSAPKQLLQSGKPVAPILAGELLPNKKRCEVAGYGPDASTCWDLFNPEKRSDCHYMYCSSHYIWSSCSEVGMTLDGSFCNAENTKICLDGQCVDKK